MYLLALRSVTFSIIWSHACCLARCFAETGGAATASGVGDGWAKEEVEAAREADRVTHAHAGPTRDRMTADMLGAGGMGAC